MNDILRYNDRKERVGARIRDERKQMKINQGELAERISTMINHGADISDVIRQSTISNWESGKVLPPIDKMVCLAEIFNCDVGYLLCDYDKRTRAEEDISEITGLSGPSAHRLIQMGTRSRSSRAAGWSASLEAQEIQALDCLLEAGGNILVDMYQYLYGKYDTFSTLLVDESGERCQLDKEILLCSAETPEQGTFLDAQHMGAVFLLNIQSELSVLRSRIQRKGKPQKQQAARK